MIDLHAHLLPEADHGSPDTSHSLEQLALLASCGVTAAVAAPHFYPDRESAKCFLARRKACADTLRAALNESHIPIYLGAEVQATEGIDHLPELDALCITGTNVLLLEMPFYRWSPSLYETVERLCHMPYRVILAHVNRYPTKDIRRFLRMGARAQLNAEAFGRRFVSRRYLRMVEEGTAVALGSDLHLVENYKKKKLLRTVSRYGDDQLATLRRASENLLIDAVPLYI